MNEFHPPKSAEAERLTPKNMNASSQVLSKLLYWAGRSKISIHNEVGWNDVLLQKRIYESPICEVYKGNNFWRF
jgi:hypothetical protein